MKYCENFSSKLFQQKVLVKLMIRLIIVELWKEGIEGVEGVVWGKKGPRQKNYQKTFLQKYSIKPQNESFCQSIFFSTF